MTSGKATRCPARSVALAGLLAAALSHGVAGGPAKPQADVAPPATVEDRKAVMDAQIDLLKKEAELRQAQRALAGTTSLGLPTVVSVTTFGERRLARLMTAGGQVAHFGEGDVVQPGVVVASVRPREVMVAIETGKRVTAVALQFSNGRAGPDGQRPGQGPDVPAVLLPEPPAVALPVGMPLPLRLPAPLPSAKPAPTPPGPPPPLGVPAAAAGAAAAIANPLAGANALPLPMK